MFDVLFVAGGIVTAVAILLVSLFVQFGKSWNALGGGAAKRRN
jgi:hypothetical protein